MPERNDTFINLRFLSEQYWVKLSRQKVVEMAELIAYITNQLMING